MNTYLKPGWLKEDIKKANARVKEWTMNKNSLLIDHFENVELRKNEFRQLLFTLIKNAYLDGNGMFELGDVEATEYAKKIVKDNT